MKGVQLGEGGGGGGVQAGIRKGLWNKLGVCVCVGGGGGQERVTAMCERVTAMCERVTAMCERVTALRLLGQCGPYLCVYWRGSLLEWPRGRMISPSQGVGRVDERGVL